MRILEKVIGRLEGYDSQTEYFDFTEQQRSEIISILWDEVYGEFYKLCLKGDTDESPLEAHMNIISYLYFLRDEKIEEEEYEVCEVIEGLINITESKVRKYDADTK